MTRAFVDEPASAPERVGRFRRLEPSRGPLYTDPEHERVVRVEVWSGPADDADERLRHHAQAHALSRICHPNVMPVLEVGMDERHVFVARERVRGEDLHHVLRRRQLPLDERLALFAGIARGLQAVHEAGLPFVDFAPHKVLVAPDTQPLLTDLGVGSGRSPVARYMSPEQIARRPLTAASDQFSFGVALYEALFFRHPFVHTDVASLHTAVLEGRVVPCDARGVPGRVEAAVLRCLQTPPRARFGSMGEVAEVLESVTGRTKPLVTMLLCVAAGSALVAFVPMM